LLRRQASTSGNSLSSAFQMASNYVCQACLRTLKPQRSSSLAVRGINYSLNLRGRKLTNQKLETTPISRRFRLAYPLSRSFQTSIRLNAASNPSPLPRETTDEVPQPSVQTPKDPKGEPASPTTKAQVAGRVPKASQLASAIRRRATGITETYVAFGSTESLLKECAAQASYTLPNTADKSATITKTPDGQDLGIGKGWWYEGKAFHSPPPSPIHSIANLSPNSLRPSTYLQHLGSNHIPTHVHPPHPHPYLPRLLLTNLATTFDRSLLHACRIAHGYRTPHYSAHNPHSLSQRLV